MESETNRVIGNYNLFFYATMCHVCKRFGDCVRLRKCGGCGMIAYCNRQHQKKHWAQHKSLCEAIRNVLRYHELDGRDVTAEEWNNKKSSLMLLVSVKLGRPLELYETQMFQFPRVCAVCHERNGQLLEDCQNCITVSFCKDHKDDTKTRHRDICVSLQQCLHTNLLFISEEGYIPDMHYLRHISDKDISTFQNMKDFIDTYANIQADSEMSYNILAAKHSEYLTRPLTLLFVMQILDCVPKREKNVIVHVIGANSIEENTLGAWEILLHLIRAPISLLIVMIGPELTFKSISLQTCDDCTLRGKKLALEFHKVLYENYVCSPLFVKPDLVVGYNAGIFLEPTKEIWGPAIEKLAVQNCPFILTSYMQQELKQDIDAMNTILDRRVHYFYSGKNQFSSLRPFRVSSPEQVIYSNHYFVIYSSLCS